MLRRHLLIAVVLALVPASAVGQATYRLRGVVRDHTEAPVQGVKVRAEALTGFRGEQFVGQKEFSTTTNNKGEWTLLGLTSGLWSFEATGKDVVPHVLVLPINFTNRRPGGSANSSFPWELPLWVRRTAHEGLTKAAEAATARKTNDAMQLIGAVMSAEKDADVLCAAGELALLIRQHSLGMAIFEQVHQTDASRPCAVVGMASAALMQNDFDRASKMAWTAIELVPQPQKAAFGAAVKDLQQIASTKQD